MKPPDLDALPRVSVLEVLFIRESPERWWFDVEILPHLEPDILRFVREAVEEAISAEVAEDASGFDA